MKNKMHVFCTKYKSLKEILAAVKQWQEENVLPLTVLQDVVIEGFDKDVYCGDHVIDFYMAFYRCGTEEAVSTNTAFAYLYIQPYMDLKISLVMDSGNGDVHMLTNITQDGESFELVAFRESYYHEKSASKKKKK